MHGLHETARSSRIIAEVGFGGQRRLAGTQRFLEVAPGRVELVAVADDIAHEGRAARDQEHGGDGRVLEPARTLCQEAQADASAQEQRRAARIEVQPGRHLVGGPRAVGQDVEYAEPVGRQERLAVPVRRAQAHDRRRIRGRVAAGCLRRVHAATGTVRSMSHSSCM